MRIAHATDIHWFVPPKAWDLRSFKRALGTANLYLAGRRHHFPDAVQAELVAFVRKLEPDLFCLTGDLTSTALPSEFAKAREALAPLLDAVPTFVIPGNHDVYTPGAQRERRIEKWFADWMFLGEGGLAMQDFGEATVIGLDPNRARRIAGSGRVPDSQLAALAKALNRTDLADRTVVLCVHYPLYHRTGGALYEGWEHGLENARDVVRILTDAPRKPDLILHGHVHHGYRSEVTLPDGAHIPVFNSGSSGYTNREKQRRAAVNVYTVERGKLLGVERYLHADAGFVPEPGGPYATGR
jgi:3',5'-cyclic AMP phosphodiesterase CpdA